MSVCIPNNRTALGDGLFCYAAQRLSVTNRLSQRNTLVRNRSHLLRADSRIRMTYPHRVTQGHA